MKKYICAIILVGIVVLAGKRVFYTSSATLTHDQLLTVTLQPYTVNLFYTGMLQPRSTIVVTSPTDGIITDINFHYGDLVDNGQLLFALVSEKFKTDYKLALMQYIKAKNELETAKSQLTETKFLYENELISLNDYKTHKTNFYNAQLTFIQEKETLLRMLKQLHIKTFELNALSIDNEKRINQALHLPDSAKKIYVAAPGAGTVLISQKTEGGDKKIEKGDAVKQGDILALIGNKNTLTVRINVNEFDINLIKKDLPVSITGPAFPDFVLQGFIASIEHQAHTGASGQPTFTVDIVVPNLTLQQQAVVHIGMSAKVEIHIEKLDQIILPLAAVKEKEGHSFVIVQNAQTGKREVVTVKVGQTTENGVIILSKLKPGDRVVIAN